MKNHNCDLFLGPRLSTPIRAEHPVLLFSVIYVLIFGLNFFFDPMAQSPQLDAKENLVLAHEIDQGALEKAPFYRAIVYPFILSLLEPDNWRAELGLILGLASHLLAGWLVFLIGTHLWPIRCGGTLAASLYLLNPASLFYAAQLLDVTFATALFLGGLWMGLRPSRRWWSVVSCGLLLGLAAVTRPHFLPVSVIAPVSLILLRKEASPKPLLALIPLFLVLIIHGFFNQLHSGEFRILPWQGAYNLWAANKPGANGLYFRQSVDVSKRGNASNPARMESVYLYGLAHPEEAPPYAIDAMNDHWRSKFLEHLKSNPIEMAKLWFFKAYAVVNSFEQYNNLTFSFHKARISALRYNPLGWGVLFTIGTAGFIHLMRTRPRLAIAWALIFLAYSSMLILFYASARFRLPLVPLVAVMAGGAMMLVRDAFRERRLPIPETVAALVAAMLTFSTYGDIRSNDTYVQDRLLMANAHAELGEDAEAAHYAHKVLSNRPDRREAQRIYAVSYFNMRLEDNSHYTSFGEWKDQMDVLQLESTTDPVLASIYAFYLWHWGEQEKAASIWSGVAQSAHSPSQSRLAHLALAAINWGTDGTPGPEVMVVQQLLNKADDN